MPARPNAFLSHAPAQGHHIYFLLIPGASEGFNVTPPESGGIQEMAYGLLIVHISLQVTPPRRGIAPIGMILQYNYLVS
jgi:hypothetical protein